MKPNRTYSCGLGVLLATSLVLTGCNGKPLPRVFVSEARTLPAGTVQLMVVPKVVEGPGYQAQAIVTRHSRASIAQLWIRIFELQGGIEIPVLDSAGQPVAIRLAPAELDGPVRISNLRPDHVYRIRSQAFDAQAADPAHQISLDAASYVDVLVGRDDLVASTTLPVVLSDVVFAGQADGTIRVREGAISHSGGVSTAEITWQASYSIEANEVTPASQFTVSFDPDAGETSLIAGDYTPLPESGDLAITLRGVVLSPDHSRALAIKYEIKASDGQSVAMRLGLTPEQSEFGLALLEAPPPTEEDLQSAIDQVNAYLAGNASRSVQQIYYVDPHNEAAKAGFPGYVPKPSEPLPKPPDSSLGTAISAGVGGLVGLASVIAWGVWVEGVKGCAGGWPGCAVGAAVGGIVYGVAHALGTVAGGGWPSTSSSGAGSTQGTQNGSAGRGSSPRIVTLSRQSGYLIDDLTWTTEGNLGVEFRQAGDARIRPGTYRVTATRVPRIEERGYRYDAIQLSGFGQVVDANFWSGGSQFWRGISVPIGAGSISVSFFSPSVAGPGWRSWTFRPKSGS